MDTTSIRRSQRHAAQAIRVHGTAAKGAAAYRRLCATLEQRLSNPVHLQTGQPLSPETVEGMRRSLEQHRHTVALLER